MPALTCPTCGGLARLADHPCDACAGTGAVPACASCGVEPVDPMFAPACGSVCRETWNAAQRLEQLRERSVTP